jgi:HPt (histidine-containing phosphotransfer) domain-containing protein
LPGLMRAAHTMKGMLRNLSMNRAGEIAYAVETAAREKEAEQAEASLAQLELAFAELLPEVDAQLAEVKA